MADGQGPRWRLVVDKILGDIGSMLFELLENAAFQFGRLDLQVKLVIFGGLCLLLLLFRFRARLVSTSGQRGLRRAWRKLAKSGVADWELPFRLLSEREEWDMLPKEFLMELASRLVERDKVIEFILMVEDDEFDREYFVRLTNYEPETAMQELSVMLADHAADLKPRDAIEMLELAVLIDPENHLALIDLATQHYTAKRYAEALPLLEQAMSLSQQVMPQGRGAGSQHPGANATNAHTLHDMLKLLGEMYEDCAERVGAKTA